MTRERRRAAAGKTPRRWRARPCGRNLYNHRMAGILYARATNIMGAEDNDEQAQAYDTEEELVIPQVTSSATLLAMARPAKSQRRCCSPAMQTDGEAFEIVEVDGRLVALDETDGRFYRMRMRRTLFCTLISCHRAKLLDDWRA